MRHRGIGPAMLALLVGGSLLAACGGGGGGGSSASLTLYSGQHLQTAQVLVAGFEKATGIHVAVRDGDEDTLANQIATEGDRSPADVFYTENSPPLEYLQERHLLAKVDPATLARTPSRFSSSAGDWVGVSARVSVLVYDPARISRSRLPTTALAMADPKYRGEVALAPGETDFQPVVTSMAHTYGQAATVRWLQGLKENAAGHIYPDNETVTDQVNRGTVAFGIINQYYWYRLRAEIGASGMHSALAHFAPGDPGYVLDVSGAAVLRSSSHQAAAQRLLAFLVSRKGQELIAHSDSFEYTIASGVQIHEGETPFDQLHPNPIGVSELGDGSRAVALIRQAGLL